MKYLIHYNRFNEGMDPIEFKKMELEKKEKIAENKAKIDEYTKKSPILKGLYTDRDSDGNFKTKDDILDTKVSEVIGKSDPKSGKYSNDLLQDLKTILSYERRVIRIEKSMADDTITKDNVKQQISSAPDDSTKKGLTTKLTDIDKRINLNKGDVSKLLIDLNKSKKELDLKVAKLKK